MTVTQWFDGSEKPTRKGVYERCHQPSRPISFPFYWWNGIYWSAACGDTPDDAVQFLDLLKMDMSSMQDLPWRGLAEQP